MFVGIQLLLFAAYLFRIPALDVHLHYGVQLLGLLIAVGGVLVALASIYALRKSLSVFPTPKENAALIEAGVYRYMRHPIYTGVLLVTFGYALYSANGLRFLIFLALLLLFRLKARYEERLLLDKFPNYEQYKSKAGMFLPKF